MKVLLYFQNYNMITKSGIGRALKLQIEALTSNGIEYTLDSNDDFDIAHINTCWAKSWKVLKKCKKKGIPVIVHGHSIVEDMAGSFTCWQIADRCYTRPHILKMYRNADLIISPTKFSSDIIRNYKNVTCEVIPLSNGINLDEYAYDENKVKQFQEKFNLNENDKVIIGVGIPFKRKGFFDFIDVAKNMPNIKFIWFGGLNEILLPKKNVWAMHHLPNNMCMPGYIDCDVIKGAFMSSTAVFFPSILETEGIVVLEALAGKTPLIIRDIDTYKDWLENDVNCFKGINNTEFAGLITKIIENDTKNIVENGYKVASERDIKKIGASLKRIYEKLLSNKK